jgi:hypothetical protein
MKTQSLMTLRRVAGSDARWRGHYLRWSLYHGQQKSIWTGTCVHCEAWVQVNTHPVPNETNIAGPAIAMNCPFGEKK